MTRKAFVAGVGMTPFTKPGQNEPYTEMGAAAIRAALADAGLDYSAVQQAYAGYVYGDSTCGQGVIYKVGMSGIPIVNVNNNCSTGSSALFLARQAVTAGIVDCALAVGFEQMNPGALGTIYTDRPSPTDAFGEEADDLVGDLGIPSALRLFGGAGKSHMDKHGTTIEDFARIRAKASRHAGNNPKAVFRAELTPQDVLDSESFAKAHGLSTGVEIAGQAMTTDTPSTFQAHDMMQLVGYDMAAAAAASVYEAAGVGPEDVDVVELHDCFAHNELITYEALGLCPQGGAQKYIAEGGNTYGGRHVTNPSGGLLSKGHPLGATGLAQCYELTRQLRGKAEATQVEGARIALQHNLGLGGACVVTLYKAA